MWSQVTLHEVMWDHVIPMQGHSKLQSLITYSMQTQICAGWCTILTSNSPAHSGDRRCGTAPSQELHSQRIWLAAAQGLQGTGHWYQSNSAHPGWAGEWCQVEVREKNSATINVSYWWELWWGFSKGTDIPPEPLPSLASSPIFLATYEFKGHICSEESGAGEGLAEAMSSQVKLL